MSISIFSTYRNTLLIIVIFIIGGLFVQFSGSGISMPVTEQQAFAQQVNLAMRRTAHQLLTMAGDKTTRIEAVKQLDKETFQLRMIRNFNYDKLPAILSESLKQHNITSDYDVAVFDCKLGELQLGYSIRDLDPDAAVPCGGRSQEAGCYVVQVRFRPVDAPDTPSNNGVLVGLAGVVVALVLVVYARKKPVEPLTNTLPETEPKKSAAPEEPQWQLFGESRLHVQNPILVAGDNQYELTYREAKLLRLFVAHPQQVLDRELILKAVWQDEGVVVGRSIDVFVSRLRKLLQGDPTLRIAAVHGIGYRLEIRKPEDYPDGDLSNFTA
ncbi:winged helix-turn-helix domain-containing protein [Arsenicibacter rosenii]|uniref:OmpR/PhoB-type domain-containing protein n=1 Tax=Arsenicibacter rosenii TaxID=1750698 RepID=A0A1S2VGW6_9BACT|nr:winged helix-turn-helix domain-containing protein [Arsenicibacter rosenii]OIN57446.1 hypothetical protein BLX24_19645 [Arsenicibacter rosenii]